MKRSISLAMLLMFVTGVLLFSSVGAARANGLSRPQNHEREMQRNDMHTQRHHRRGGRRNYRRNRRMPAYNTDRQDNGRRNSTHRNTSTHDRRRGNRNN